MKIAIAGKGGVGKTSLTAWLADYLDRVKGAKVWMIDADPAVSLGLALGFEEKDIPDPLVKQKELINERVGAGLISLNPDVEDLPAKLAATKGRKNLLVMGGISTAGGGCACSANSLVKALLAHFFIERKDEWVLVDLEAGVEHLGRGTVQNVDGLIIVSEPSFRSLNTAAEISTFAKQLKLDRQVLVINRNSAKDGSIQRDDLPTIVSSIPVLEGLEQKQLTSGSVLYLPEQDQIDQICKEIIDFFEKD